MNKQIVATSTASLSNGEKIAVRKCSEPEDDLLQIYDTLKVDHIPIRQENLCGPKMRISKKRVLGIRGLEDSWKIDGSSLFMLIVPSMFY